ncbi:MULTISPECIES: fumarylacetoacetate hydrolase family protein [Sphingobium]|jgi:2-oxopent-4-enoate/cis-2-oxohex-4-enoate hydratase|uniref:fumarylacetoacetate hydrolase family protein n=1 Tax=Sphingobium TaxID=165695 RepID=UPI00159C3FD1|nr:fumarylacetoacetate hydrolase family protein [Sphingobium sp. 15-1]
MTIDPKTIQYHGDALYDAFVTRSTLPPLRDRVEGLTIEDAYHIAARMVQRRVDAGERIIGKKIGVTSKAVQDAIGVFEPDFGQLTSGMAFDDGAVIELDSLIQPQAEAEIAFILKSDLSGPGITPDDVLRATDHVRCCFEIVDSRIQRWDIKILDTVADNASCGVFVLGHDKVDPREVDLALAGMVVLKNGELASTGVGAAVQGSPLNSVAWLADTLGRLGVPLLAGEVVLSGSLGPLVSVDRGDSLEMKVLGIGSCSLRFA